MAIASRTGFLVLASGYITPGRLWGEVSSWGEVVFNTAHCGYPEMATDPSYFNQILVCAAPHQGNYGLDPNNYESEAIRIKAFVCAEIQNSRRDSQWLQELVAQEVPVLSQVDTRNLVLHLREQGTTVGAIVPAANAAAAQTWWREHQASFVIADNEWARAVSASQVIEYVGRNPHAPHIGILDFGSKRNIINESLRRASKVTLFPYGTPAQQILASGIAVLVLSNGPGDPECQITGIETVQQLVGRIPLFGICMGHQVLALALGAKTFKLRYGHRGVNQPVQDLRTQQIYITSQNHGYAVQDGTLPASVRVSFRHLNDESIQGISCPELKCESVQFHPESHPGPRESVGVLDQFFRTYL